MIRNEDQEKMTVEIPKGQGLISAEEGHNLLAQSFYNGFLFGLNQASAEPIMKLIEGIESDEECGELIFQVFMKFTNAMNTKFFAGNLDNPVDATVFAITQNLQLNWEDSE